MRQPTRKGVFSSIVVLSLTIAVMPTSEALNPINSYKDGRIIQGGTYANTADGNTTFANSSGGSLWLKAGTTLRGIEVNASGIATNNGGTIHLYAPDSVVRVDGNIDVNAIRNGQGAALGNGGKVFIDSSYLFQNGNISANGINGGLVQANVGAMTLGAGAQIQAKGSTGAGGVVAINSAGPVDLRRGSMIDTSGQVMGSFDTNLINIEGSLINVDGSIRANGVAESSRGGTIRLVSTGQSDLQQLNNTLQNATHHSPKDVSAPTLTTEERTFILQRANGQIVSHEGDVLIRRSPENSLPTYMGQLSANGAAQLSGKTHAGDGGTIIITAAHDVVSQGTISANGSIGNTQDGSQEGDGLAGGAGGTVSLVAMNSILNDHGRIEANGGRGSSHLGGIFEGGNPGEGSDDDLPGHFVAGVVGGRGGSGGLIAFGYHTGMTNTGGIYADGGIGGNGSMPAFRGSGGNGGLIILSGNSNPTGNGSIDVIARPGGNQDLTWGGTSGTIVSPNPGILGNSQVYFQQGYVNGQLVRTRTTEQTQPVELVTHAENLMLLTKNGGNINVSTNLFTRLLQARIRSVTDPTGSLGQAQTEVISKNTASSPAVYRNLILGSSRDNLLLDMTHPWSNEGGFGDGALIFPSPLSMSEGFSTLNTLSVVNNGSISTQYLSYNAGDASYKPTNYWVIGRNSNNFGGGRLSVLANGKMDNLNVLGTTGLASGGSVNIATQGSFVNSAHVTTSGNVHGGSIMIKAGNDITMYNAPYYAIPNMSANGSLLGGTIRLLPIRDLSYLGGVYVTSINANGSRQGGVININAGRDSLITNGDFGFVETQPTLTANGTSSTLGRGGFIHINAENNNIHSNASFQATGGLVNGTVLFTTNP